MIVIPMEVYRFVKVGQIEKSEFDIFQLPEHKYRIFMSNVYMALKISFMAFFFHPNGLNQFKKLLENVLPSNSDSYIYNNECDNDQADIYEPKPLDFIFKKKNSMQCQKARF